MRNPQGAGAVYNIMTFDNPIDLTLLKDTQHSDWDSKLPTIEYPNGAIRLTRGALASPSPKRISFQEIVQPIGLQKCIFTAYCIDESWLLPHLRKVPRIVFCTHNHEGRRPPRAGRFKRGNLTVIFPPFPSFPNYGVMHSKLMLLFYSTFLRVVISSANLVAYDYEEVQNVPYYQMIMINPYNLVDGLYTRLAENKHVPSSNSIHGGSFKKSFQVWNHSRSPPRFGNAFV